MDHRVAEYMARIPVRYKVRGRTLRYLQRRLAERYLPEELLRYPKQGFSSVARRDAKGKAIVICHGSLNGFDGCSRTPTRTLSTTPSVSTTMRLANSLGYWLNSLKTSTMALGYGPLMNDTTLSSSVRLSSAAHRALRRDSHTASCLVAYNNDSTGRTSYVLAQ